VAFSADGKYIVSGSADKTIRLWNTKGKPIGQPFKGHKTVVMSVAFSPDGKYIVSGSADKDDSPVEHKRQAHRSTLQRT
jgi:WD40 repeat protein